MWWWGFWLDPTLCPGGRAWSLAGPIRRRGSGGTSGRLQRKARSESALSNPGLGVGALVEGSARGRQGLSWTHLAMGRLPRKSPRKSPKRPRKPGLLSRRFAPLPPSRPAALVARCHPDQRLPRRERCPLRPWAPRAAPSPLAGNVTARPQDSRGISRAERLKEGSEGWGQQKRLPGPGLGRISARAGPKG